MTQNEHVYTICCRLEVAGDVISGESVKTTEGYALLNVEVASISSFREKSKSATCVMRWYMTVGPLEPHLGVKD